MLHVALWALAGAAASAELRGLDAHSLPQSVRLCFIQVAVVHGALKEAATARKQSAELEISHKHKTITEEQSPIWVE